MAILVEIDFTVGGMNFYAKKLAVIFWYGGWLHIL